MAYHKQLKSCKDIMILLILFSFKSTIKKPQHKLVTKTGASSEVSRESSISFYLM